MTQENVAGMAGVSIKALMEFEGGKPSTETNIVAGIFNLLGIDAPIICKPSIRAAVVKACRKRLGIDQIDLAGMAGITQRYLSAIETEKENLRINKLLAVTNALGIDVLNPGMVAHYYGDHQ